MFCLHTLERVRVFCYKMSQGMKPGSCIFNVKPSSCGWNGTTLHFQRRMNLSVCCPQKNINGYSLLKWEMFLTFMPMGATLKSDHCTATPRTLNACLCQFHPTNKISEVLLLHDNTWPHISVHTNVTITKFGWAVFATTTLESWTWFSPVWSFRKTSYGDIGHFYVDDKALQNSLHQLVQGVLQWQGWRLHWNINTCLINSMKQKK